MKKIAILISVIFALIILLWTSSVFADEDVVNVDSRS